MPENFKLLKWDTGFFNFNVAEIKKDVLNNPTGRIGVFNQMLSAKIELAYYKSSVPFTEMENDYYDIKFIVKRIPLEKKVKSDFPIHKNISLYEKEEPEESLISLAQLAGRQGRFGKDPNVSDEVCDEIFKRWIVNSVNKKMASHVLVYKEEEEIVGFATIDIRNGKGYTPLFAVDRKSEGKGVSFALMRAVETILKQNECPVAVGGTQDLNRKALMVYQRYGLIPQAPEYIYHCWKK